MSVTFLFGASMGPFTRHLMEWVHEEGFCDEATRDKDWIDYGVMLYDGREPIAEYERVKGVLDDFFMTKTKAELFAATFSPAGADRPGHDHRGAGPQRAPWPPAASGRTSSAASARRRSRFPGAFAKLSATPLPVHGRRRPPRRAHRRTGRAEAARRPGGPGGEPAPAGARQRRRRPPTPGGRPLEGLKVADFMWVFAGPYASRVLADLGATVVRVESMHHLDTLRTAGNFQDDKTDVEWDLQFGNINAGKLGLALDLSKPEAREVAIDLVRWADVTMESFTPKTMAAWGLDYESLRERQARPGHGLELPDGPLRAPGQPGRLRHDGGRRVRLVQRHRLARPPAVRALRRLHRLRVAPLPAGRRRWPRVEHRRRTGEGQYIDLSQAEASPTCSPRPCSTTRSTVGCTGRVGNDDPVLGPPRRVPRRRLTMQSVAELRHSRRAGCRASGSSSSTRGDRSGWRRSRWTSSRPSRTNLRTPLAVIRSAAQNLSAGVVHDAGAGPALRRSHRSRRPAPHGHGRAGARVRRAAAAIAGRDGAAGRRRRRSCTTSSRHPQRSSTPRASRSRSMCRPIVPPVIADEDAIRRALHNLVTNALKYGGDGRWVGIIGRASRRLAARRKCRSLSATAAAASPPRIWRTSSSRSIAASTRSIGRFTATVSG